VTNKKKREAKKTQEEDKIDLASQQLKGVCHGKENGTFVKVSGFC